ncbi:hypothetical protein HRI_004953000 [Hibiscus trionum]|uniref:Uncharacterized protein n=1 Tax=Hibiscus trionum TaxID=183268 RepID=A0A9W7JHE6_HIBTR|nr:hypothetical protein HRI_004953000 [Hibiscus trionum]
MNGIKEDMKSIGVMDYGGPAYKEGLSNLSDRLKSFSKHCKEYFEEEEEDLLPLVEAAELSGEEEMRVFEECFNAMRATHSHLFNFFLEGLIPSEAMEYVDLMMKCSDKQHKASLFQIVSNAKPDSSSKSDKKFDKKLQFYAKVRDTVASLTTKKDIRKKKLQSRQKKLKAYDLSALSEFLPELKASNQPTPANDFKLSCKSRLKEGKQLNAVLEHPAFQADPLAAIHQHLQNTQPVADEKPKKKANKNGGKKKKNKKSKASSGSQSMDI